MDTILIENNMRVDWIRPSHCINKVQIEQKGSRQGLQSLERIESKSIVEKGCEMMACSIVYWGTPCDETDWAALFRVSECVSACILGRWTPNRRRASGSATRVPMSILCRLGGSGPWKFLVVKLQRTWWKVLVSHSNNLWGVVDSYSISNPRSCFLWL